jgi:thioredoxin-dependent peroxiredoxin
MKLNKGDTIDSLELPSTSGGIFNIKDIAGKKTLLTFYRFASCPFCNLRINELTKRYSELGTDFEIVAIFDSPLIFLIKNAKKHNAPFTILADENFEYFKRYDVEQSTWKFIVGSILGSFKIFRAFAKGYIPLQIKGSMRTVPVDILIKEDGTIEKAYYGKNTTNHLKFDDIKRFSLG